MSKKGGNTGYSYQVPLTGLDIGWFPAVRVSWIVESVRIFGFINREHVMRKFGISKPQASNDLRLVLSTYPKLMAYDSSRKAYVLLEKRCG